MFLHISHPRTDIHTLSIINAPKTPTGKAKKGQVSVRLDSGSIKACFPRSYCNQGQIKLATGISLVDGWEAKASQLQRRLQLELEDGKLDDGCGNFDLSCYNEILKQYGLQAKLRVGYGKSTTNSQQVQQTELDLLKEHLRQQQTELDLLKEQLCQQQELINKLLQDTDK